jgi:hypothetical protein
MLFVSAMERQMQHTLCSVIFDNQASSTAGALPVVVNGLAAIRKQTDATGRQAGKTPCHSAQCPKPLAVVIVRSFRQVSDVLPLSRESRCSRDSV